MPKSLIFILIGSFSIFVNAQEKNFKEIFDVTYYKSDSVELKLDLFIPKNISKPTPLVVGLHGGAWVKGNRKNFHRACKGFAERGYIAASVSYRLAGAAPFPAQIQDVQAAIRWLKIHANTYNIDSSKVAVTGFSAGGHLAALAGAAGNSTNKWPALLLAEDLDRNIDVSHVKPTVKVAIPMAGQSNFNSEYTKRVSATKAQYFYSVFLSGSYAENPETYLLASPLEHLDKNDPPTFFITGSKDHISTHGKKFRDKLNTLNIENDLLIIKGAPHVFLTNPEWKKLALDFAVKYLDKYLKK